MMLNSIIQSLNDNIGGGLRKINSLSELEFDQILALSEESLKEGLKRQFLRGDLDGLMDIILHGDNASKDSAPVVAEITTSLSQDLGTGLAMKEEKATAIASTIVGYVLDELGRRLINSRFEDNPAGLIELTGLNQDEDFMNDIHNVINDGQLSNSGLNQLFRNQ